MLDTALSYARRGWSIVPVRFQNDPKRPAVRWKRYQQEPPSTKTLRRWFSNGKYSGMSVVLGAVSGHLVCRDFDEEAAYERWKVEFPDLAATLATVRTGKGYHVYFMAVVEKTGHFPDGELRGEGATCVVPPSPHPNGSTYEWLIAPSDENLLPLDPETAGFIPQDCLPQKSTEEHRRAQKQAEAVRSKLSAKGKREDELELAIISTLPKQPGQRNYQVFQLARALWGISSLADADPRSLEPVVRRWHSLALPHISTKPFEETWFDFLYAWPRVETPMRLNLLEDAMTRARENPIPDLQYEQEEVRDLVALCRELQAMMGDQPFFLSCRTAGRLFDVDPKIAWRWLFGLEQDGWIETVARGDRHRATRFRYTGKGRQGDPKHR